MDYERNLDWVQKAHKDLWYCLGETLNHKGIVNLSYGKKEGLPLKCLLYVSVQWNGNYSIPINMEQAHDVFKSQVNNEISRFKNFVRYMEDCEKRYPKPLESNTIAQNNKNAFGVGRSLSSNRKPLK